MAVDRSLANTQPARPKRSWGWLIYVAGALALAGVIASATLQEIARNPARGVTADLGPYGLVTVRFSTDPNPALPIGTVTLNFLPMDSRQRPVALDIFPLNMDVKAAISRSAQARHSSCPTAVACSWAARSFPRLGIGGCASK
jgi:hypothetical protein